MHGHRVVDRYQWPLVDESEQVGGRHAGAAVCGVGVGMAHPQRAPRLAEPADDVAVHAQTRHLMHRPEQQRVMADQQVCSPLDGLTHDLHGGIRRELDAPHRGGQVPHDQSGMVP